MSEITHRIYKILQEQIVKQRRLIVIFFLLVQTALANYLAFNIRFELIISSEFLNRFLGYLPILLCIRLLLYLQAGLYKGMWRYASISDLLKIIKSATIGSILFLLTIRYLFADMSYPLSIYVLDWLLFILISGGSRFFIRVFREYMILEPSRKRVLIIGAGDVGEMMVREMRNNREFSYEPIGFIDEDREQAGRTIHGVPILGSSSRLADILKQQKPDEILIADPAHAQATIREVYETCKPFNLPIKKLPGLHDMLSGTVSVSARLGQKLVEAQLVTEDQIEEALALQKKEGGRLGAKLVKLKYIREEQLVSFLDKHFGISHLQPLSLEDLLLRAPVQNHIESLDEFISGKRVMITGAGGSIGAELCRQIMRYNPSEIHLFDRYENSLFEIDLELREQNGSNIITIIGDIQDSSFLNYVFSKHRPQIVFHAAAYKHVPLMEDFPIEAVKNNILGTKNLIDTASHYCVENFVQISTDKAVNPTSIMGATKRVAEYLTVQMNSACKTKFTTVRFGNVLGTNGSVVPIFKEQLKKGGPLTVTHPEIERFFMLIPEAVQLVLIAASSGKGGEIFVLDMGKRIKILDFAENFIRLSGFVPHDEIKITFTGLRPGEKLYEELFDDSEKIIPTAHEKLFKAVPDIPSKEFIENHLSGLGRALQNYATDEVLSIMQRMVPNYQPQMTEQLNGKRVNFLNVQS
jgi:FlaA1/EpsC-like NDP-sugar epimerase